MWKKMKSIEWTAQQPHLSIELVNLYEEVVILEEDKIYWRCLKLTGDMEDCVKTLSITNTTVFTFFSDL
jgi:hypothetical protein